MPTLPTFSKTMDNKFMQTWYEIQAQVVDNVLLGTPVWAVLKLQGCFDTQTGGTNIERSVRYAVGPTASAVAKGSTLPSGEVETRTAAFWTFRNIAAHAQRTIFEDDENQGKFRIVSYVSQRLEEARDALKQKFETDLWRAHVTDESGLEIQGLNDMVPPSATRTTGTYGGITRPTTFAADSFGVSRASVGNTFWGACYKGLTAPAEANLVTDMNTLYNGITSNYESPNLVISDQGFFEIYQNQALNMAQIVKESNGPMADLGFDVIKFQGKRWVWTPNITASNMLMINTNWVEVIYSPTMWFEPTDWKWAAADSDTRLMHILCRFNIFTRQPRRQGRLA
jgi:hypothetical protein